jgi:tetratricopeptide (TPR) repeat protein
MVNSTHHIPNIRLWALLFVAMLHCHPQPESLSPLQLPEPAVPDEESALDQNADWEEIELRRNLILALLEENEYGRAWQHLNVVLESGADSWWLHLAAAQICLYWRQDYPCVTERANRTLSLRAGNARAHFYLGQAAQDQGQIELAISHYQQGLERRPREPDMAISLANLLNSQGEVADALNVLEDASRLTPNYPPILLRIAAILEPTDIEGSEYHYQQAIAHHDDPIIAVLHLIRFYRRHGRDADANALQAWRDDQIETEVLRPLR